MAIFPIQTGVLPGRILGADGAVWAGALPWKKTPAEVSIAFLSKRRGPAGLLISTNSKTANRTRVFLRIMASNGKGLREGELSFLRFEISKHRLAGASDNGFWIHGFFSASKFPSTSPRTTV